MIKMVLYTTDENGKEDVGIYGNASVVDTAIQIDELLNGLTDYCTKKPLVGILFTRLIAMQLAEKAEEKGKQGDEEQTAPADDLLEVARLDAQIAMNRLLKIRMLKKMRAAAENIENDNPDELHK